MYKIIGRVIKRDTTGIEIYYKLEDRDTNKIVSMLELIELAKCGKVESCKVIEYNNKDYIKCLGFKLSSLPVINDNNSVSQVTIKSRIMLDNKLYGYVIEDKDGHEREISTTEAWVIASYNGIKDVKAQIQGKSKYLVGINGTELKSKNTIYKQSNKNVNR